MVGSVVPILLALGCQVPAEEPSRERLVESGSMTCAEPGDRESLGPFFKADLGADWERQRPLDVEEDEFLRGDPIGVGDLDGDGRLDVVLSDRSEVQVFLQDAECFLSRAYEDLSMETREWRPAAISLLDLDEDGWLDLLVGVTNGIPRFYRNLEGSGFEDQTEAMGFNDSESKPRAFTWGDVDGDGDLDLFVGNDRIDTHPPDPGLLNSWLENQGSMGFLDVSDRLEEEVLDGYTKNVAWLDLDEDGDLDLYVMNHMPGYSGNYVMQNDGLGGLTAWEGTGLDLSMSSMGLDVADLNGDGFMDLAIAGKLEIALLLGAPGPSWYRSDIALGLILDGVERVTAWSTNLADLDNDSRVDVVASFGASDPDEDPGFEDPEEQPDGLWLQSQEGQFTDRATEWGMDQLTHSRVIGAIDLNGDGWLDMIKSSRKARTDVWLARCGAESWLRVRLDGPAGNPHGLGAKVSVHTEGGVQTRWMSSGAPGYLLSAPYELHFGLDTVEEIDRLEVQWADGSVDHWEWLELRQFVRARHVDATAEANR